MENQLLPQEETFKALLINPYDISKFNFKSPDYREILLNLDIYQEITLSPKTLAEDLYTLLNLSDFSQVSINSMALWETKDYLYEMIHLDLPLQYLPTEIYNGMANLLRNEMFHLFGKVILVKTQINCHDDSFKMVDFVKKDLEDLLINRVKHYGVKLDLDGELEQFEFWYDPKDELNKFFTDGKSFTEVSFLNHNLQIYYTKGSNKVLEKLIDTKIEQVLILTKITDEFYSNFTLEEYQKIIKLLKSECPLETPTEWLEEKKDTYNRRILINKYRVLEKALKEYCS
jgi:hypothetical protein